VSQKEFSLGNLGMPHARENKGAIMAKVIIGNQSAVTVPRQDRDSIRRFYCDVLGGKIVKEDNEKDILRLQEEFYIVFRYGDVPDESEFLRSSRSIWLQIQSDNVEEMTRKILDFGVRKLDIPAPHLYFQAPGGQCFQLIGINEDRSYYKGAGDGTNVAKEKEAEALKDEAMSKLASGHHQKKSTKL
jgi:catechol 2,3-dioxygenase-like lactoylglutathione lyase family enzyme